MSMVGEIFYWVLNMSVLGSALGLVLLLLRRISSLPRFFIYSLWSLPLLRLLLPVALPARYSLLSAFSRAKSVPMPLETGLTLSNFIQFAEEYFPIVYKNEILEKVFTVAGMIWLVIALVLILCSVVLYFLTKSALRDAVHIKENIYRSEKLLSPAVYGIFKPKIVLPPNISEEDLSYILAHERLHIRRRDNLWRVIAVVTACVHWFNPLAWVFLKCFFSDMELACDAGVLKGLSDEDKKKYASALLSCNSERTYYASAFGGAKTRVRVENILSYKRMTAVSAVCFVVLFVIIAIAVMTNAGG